MTSICFLFASVFVNLLQFIEDEWLLLVDCIENGVIPDLDKIDHVREALKVRLLSMIRSRSADKFYQKKFTANPARATELRKIGPPHGIEGWAVRIWPALKKFIGITGGSAAAAAPKVWACQSRFQRFARFVDMLTTDRLLVSLGLRSPFRIVVMAPQNVVSPCHITMVTLLLTSR